MHWLHIIQIQVEYYSKKVIKHLFLRLIYQLNLGGWNKLAENSELRENEYS